MEQAPRKGRGNWPDRLQVALVELHSTTAQEFQIFLVKRTRAVMLLLHSDILSNRLALRSAYGERTITFLPSKVLGSYVVMHPFGRDSLELPQYVRQAMRSTQTDEQGYMVGNATNDLRHTAQGADNTAHERMQLWPPCGRDARIMVFGAEDQMIMQAQMG